MRYRAIWALVPVSVLAAGALLWMQAEKSVNVADASLSLDGLLGESPQGFSQPGEQWEPRFPQDHGAHPGFRSEVWSVSGQLADEQGGLHGFQLTFFRLAMTPNPPERASAWSANQVYRAHLSLIDGPGARFHAFERFSRAALGLAGADRDPVRVWLGDWSMETAGPGDFRLRAAEGEVGLALDLQSVKPMLRQGQVELVSRPLGGTGGAHFYLIPRLSAEGSLRLGKRELAVSGLAWLDRLWGEVPSARGQLVFNRFSLQLDDGRDLLCLELRRREGGGTPIPSCLLIAADGSATHYDRRGVRLEPEGRWASPVDGTLYPVRWRILIPDQELELAVVPMMDRQELEFALRAWSGTVTVSGSARGSPLTGRGQLTLTGYAGSPPGV